MKTFGEAAKEATGFYVYRLIDPRDGVTFYVGKGTGDRVFAHVDEADKDLNRATHKLDCIRAIKNCGLDVRHIIHRHGLTEKEAFEVEAALIDAFDGLTNLQGGLYSEDRGAMTAEEVAALYDPETADIVEPVVLINIRQEWYRGISPERLYERTRQYWACNPERHPNVRYAMAIKGGIVRQVYEIDKWEKVDTKTVSYDPSRRMHDKPRGKTNLRWRFTGSIAEDMLAYVGKSVAHLQVASAQNPIRWVNC